MTENDKEKIELEEDKEEQPAERGEALPTEEEKPAAAEAEEAAVTEEAQIEVAEEPVSPMEAGESVTDEEFPREVEAEGPEEEEAPVHGRAVAHEAEKKVRPDRARMDKLTTLPSEESADLRWYVVHAHSGHENKVRQSIENRVRQENLEHLVTKILVPSEEVAEIKGGKKRVTSRKIFPGYVMVEMKLTHKTWYLIRTTPGVTGFIGSGKMPTPLDPEEVESIFEQMRGERKKPKPKVSFEKEEKVKIIEGPFTNFMGYVDEVNAERGKLKVMVEIFERLTPVELEFWQVEKV
jgi:transcriptional antiterminator NusG